MNDNDEINNTLNNFDLECKMAEMTGERVVHSSGRVEYISKNILLFF